MYNVGILRQVGNLNCPLKAVANLQGVEQTKATDEFEIAARHTA